MFDDHLRTTYEMCSNFARWAQLYCRELDHTTIALHHHLLARSQSLPIFCAAAGAAPDKETRLRSLQRALKSALEISEAMSNACTANTGDAITPLEGIRIINMLITRLMTELSPVILTPQKVRRQRAVRKIP